MLRILGVFFILLIRWIKDNIVNKSRVIDFVLIKEVSWFLIVYKKDGNIIQVIVIINRLFFVFFFLFIMEIMRRFDVMINVEQMIKQDFLFI